MTKTLQNRDVTLLRDSDIRASLAKHLSKLHYEEPNTRIVGEFSLCEGSARIDIAVVNGSLIGYEIKSDSDTLERLPFQQEIYSQVFNRVTIVVGEHHSDKVTKLIPYWWGIWIPRKFKNGIQFEVLREPQENPQVDPNSLVKCLWRDEALVVLRDRNLADGLEKAKRSVLREKLANSLTYAEINAIVCDYLRSRSDWSIVLTPE